MGRTSAAQTAHSPSANSHLLRLDDATSNRMVATNRFTVKIEEFVEISETRGTVGRPKLLFRLCS